MAEFMALDLGFDAENDLRIAHAQAIEDMFAACMRGEGFDYIAVDMSNPAFGPISDVAPVPEDVEAYGYVFNLQLFLSADDPSAVPSGLGPPQAPNPNQPLVEAMDEAEEQEFQIVGDGCMTSAYDLIPDPFSIPSGGNVDLQRWLVEEIRKLSDRMGDDPEVRRVEQSWTTCIAEAGYDFATRSAIFRDLDERIAPLWIAVEAAYQRDGVPSLNDDESAALEALELYEREVAEVDADCRVESGYDDVRRQVRVRVESEFVDQNSDRLALIQSERLEALESLLMILDS